jgi:Fimbrial assembly protein (PilN)
LAIAEACSPGPPPAATSLTPSSAGSVASPATSSTRVPDRKSSDDRPIAVIAKILTQQGPAGGWDPSRLWLLAYDENDGAVDLVCGMRDAEDVAEFLKRLAASPTFENVKLLTASNEDPRGLHAEITAKVAQNGRTHITPANQSEFDFGKGDRNPFEVLATAPPLPPEGIASDSDLDQLKLVGIVSGDSPRAMFTDQAEKGWTVKVGDQVGKPDPTPACSWRVADVKSSAVVMTRADATACNTNPPQQVFRIAKKKR